MARTSTGAGVIYTELSFMETVSTPCEDCGGKRFEASVLELRFGVRNIAEVLEMPVSEALAFFSEGEARTPAAAKILARLESASLGYVNLGQPLTTLAGGGPSLVSSRSTLTGQHLAAYVGA